MASEIKVDTVSEKTSGSGVTIDGLLIKDGGISGDVSLIGTTPTFTIGDAGAEDAALVFDGNAQDYYIALDDSADDLLIGLGSTVGTTPAIAIDENLKVNIPVTTASTSTSTGSLTTGGGMGVGADLYVGDDAYLITDSAVLGFGADKDTTLTHTDGTGLTLNSTNKLTFGDAASFIHQSGDGVLTIDGEVTIDLNASTAVLVSNDLKLNSDAAVLGFGADNEVTLTHVHNAGLILGGTLPTLTIGDGDTEDTTIKFDGNAHDFRMGIDDSTDIFEIGHGTTAARYGAVSIEGVAKKLILKGGVTDSSAAELGGAAAAHLKHENSSALYVDVADDATITPSILGVGGSVFFVGTWASGGQGYRSAVYAGTYGHATIVKLADPTDSFDVAATDGKNIGVTSTTNSDVATLTNKSGVTLRVIVSALAGQGL
jgi:hypothetical protein